ncbi:hypothetical protein P3875_04815 [Myroides sp. JBRI-B21084]|uniref:hypothetical protein n=1 Tax=Myroides sp. JBRI-B21084 TaxID=3119977 RepID=UPI0026E3993E|nr:hypothetical protein [Paenimyroides cloacae]WKW47385.1 hypothetical protein P3875_04815 [Paenimyroides cloacae]
MKKMFLSLATIAFVAAGSLTVTSCGDDDSNPTPTPTPTPTLTKNFIQVNNDQEEITYSLYAVHRDGTGSAPIKEYTLQDGTVVAAFEFISHNGDAVTTFGTAETWTTLLTKVDTSIPVGTAGRYVLPFTTEGSTLLGGFSTTFNDTDYSYAAEAEFDVVDLNYGSETEPATMTYTLSGTDADDTSIMLKTNLEGEIDGLYSLNASSAKGLGRINPKNGQLTKIKSLN